MLVKDMAQFTVILALGIVVLFLVIGLYIYIIYSRRKLLNINIKLSEWSNSLSFTLANIDEGIIIVDIDKNIIFANDSIQRLIGHRNCGIIGNNISRVLNILDEKTRIPIDILKLNSINDGEANEEKIRGVLLSRSGVERLVDCTTKQIKNKNDIVEGAVISLRDETDFRITEANLRKERDFSNGIIDYAGVIIVVWTKDGRIIRFNRFAQEITGYREEEVMGKPWPEIFSPEMEKEDAYRVIKRILQGEDVQNWESQILCKSGNFISVLWNYSILYDQDGQFSTAISMGVDVTQRKMAEVQLTESYQELEATYQELAAIEDELRWSLESIQQRDEAIKETKEQYRLTVDASNDGIWDINLKTKNVYLSARWKTMLGYEEDEIQDSIEAWRSLIHHDDCDRIMTGIMEHIYSKTPYYTDEYRLKTKDGKYKWILIRGQAIRDENEEPIRILGSHTDITHSRKIQKDIEYIAFYDTLTGLPNRAQFSRQIKKLIEECQRKEDKFALFYMDIDNFKNVNDSIGHDAGDELLKSVGDYLTQYIVSKGDLIARLGGDEFALLLPSIKKISDAEKIAEKIIEGFARSWHIQDRGFYFTTSIGIALYPEHGADEFTLVKNADTAMYIAKEQGKNNYKIFDDLMNISLMERIDIENKLRDALEREELMVYYQPQVNIKTLEIVGVEALVRWHHTDYGFISPTRFIPIAEETGMIFKLGESILRNACIQNKLWQESGYPPIVVSVNLSPMQFQQDDLIQMIEDILMETGLNPQWLELEITESVAMMGWDHTIEILNKLRKIGVRISLDDFGTGYSSLNYLKRLPIDSLKIDRTFIHNCIEDAKQKKIARVVLALARSMQLTVVAEGVETVEQLEFLQKYSCDKAQGFLFSKPLPPQELEDLFDELMHDNKFVIDINYKKAAN